MPNMTFNVAGIDPGTTSAGVTGGPGTLSYALAAINALPADGSVYTINLTGDVRVSGPLSPIFNSLVINGNGHTIDAQGQSRIFFIGVDEATRTSSSVAGSILTERQQVSINDVVLANGLAKGGDGYNGGGGGMGAGGALFINQTADVTLSGVTFEDNSAVGGISKAKPVIDNLGGGGGGLGGDGASGGGGIYGDGGSFFDPSGGGGGGGGLFGKGASAPIVPTGDFGGGGGGGYSGDGGVPGQAGANGLLSIYGLNGSGGAGNPVAGNNYSGGTNGGGGGGAQATPQGNLVAAGAGGGGGFNGTAAGAGSSSPGSGGFGGGGGGGPIASGGGGFGGGGGGSLRGFGTPDGGFGGGGGGNIEGSGSAGDGGFGGGGAGGGTRGSSGDEGHGGFGGGGGSAFNGGTTSGDLALRGKGGFGTGDGGIVAGSAGAGMGGSIFVVAGGTLTIAGDGSLDGTAKAGATSIYGTSYNKSVDPGPASAFGAGIFYQGKADGSLSTLNFGSGNQTLTATVADYIGSGGTNPSFDNGLPHTPKKASDEGGSVALAKAGGGILALTTANTYSGGTFIKGGTVADGAVGALGSGPVHFQAEAGFAATLLLQKAAQPASGGTFATTLDGFGLGEALDLAGLAYTAGASAVVNGSTLTVTSGAVTQNFALTNPEASAYFVHKDAAGTGLLVNAVPVIVKASSATTYDPANTREFDLTGIYVGRDVPYRAGIVTDEGGTHLEIDNGSFSQRFDLGSADRALNLDFISNIASVTLTGGAFGDRLAGGRGNDTLAGGLGNDTYVINSNADQILENAGAGADTVQTGLSSYTLAANVENVVYTGTRAFTGTGNDLGNVLTGGGGDDTLDGRAGADTLVGGLGNDTYMVDNVKDVVTEVADAGIDTVQTTLAKYALGANVENLTYTGSGSVTGTGNALDNVLTGGAGADTLRGGAGNDTLIGNAGNDQLDGGAGDDAMSGGLGNDTYTVDSLGDRIDESGDATGIDQVNSAISFTLDTNLEKLALTGSAAIDGTGNALDNRIVGNGAVNLLHGGDGNDTLVGGAGDDTLYGDAGNDQLDGGTGADALHGGSGNDTYLVDNVGDTVDETGVGGVDAGGTDKVTLNADAYVLSGGESYALSAFVETLSLTGTAALDATGNDLANKMTGNAGANSLAGGAGNDTLSGLAGNDTLIGGAGNDTLTGGTGADTFVFGSASAASADKVTDFSSAQGDRLEFQAIDFGLGIGQGLNADRTLAEGYFEVVSGKTTAGTQSHGEFLFNTSTKVLSWDADGAGKGAAVAVATFAVPTGTVVADFLKASDLFFV